MVWQYIYFSTLIKKGLLLTVIRIRGTAETRRCDADAVRSQVITWNPALTLCASYLPLPPPPPPTRSAPLSQASALIVTLVNLTRGTQGCSKIISFDKSNWHLNFWWVFSIFLFSIVLHPHIFTIPLAGKVHSLFRQSLIRESFSHFALRYNFSPFLNKCNYSYRRIFETSLLTLFGVSLVLWRRERLITSIATPVLLPLSPKFSTSAFLIYSCFTFKIFC